MFYRYGMRLRGFSIGCQPMAGLVDWADCDSNSRYYSILVYDRKLSREEASEYDLDLLDVVEEAHTKGSWE